MIERYYATDCKVKPSRGDGKDIKVIRESDFNKAILKFESILKGFDSLAEIKYKDINKFKTDLITVFIEKHKEMFKVKDCFGEEGK